MYRFFWHTYQSQSGLLIHFGVVCRCMQLSGLFISMAMVMENALSTSKLIHAESVGEFFARIVNITSSSYVIGLRDLVFSSNWLSIM